MSVQHVELIVEELSAEAALHELLPPLLGPLTFSVHACQGKNDLLKQLPARLRAMRFGGRTTSGFGIIAGSSCSSIATTMIA
jgi:hypothetical protein